MLTLCSMRRLFFHDQMVESEAENRVRGNIFGRLSIVWNHDGFDSFLHCRVNGFKFYTLGTVDFRICRRGSHQHFNAHCHAAAPGCPFTNYQSVD